MLDKLVIYTLHAHKFGILKFKMLCTNAILYEVLSRKACRALFPIMTLDDILNSSFQTILNPGVSEDFISNKIWG